MSKTEHYELFSNQQCEVLLEGIDERKVLVKNLQKLMLQIFEVLKANLAKLGLIRSNSLLCFFA